MKTSKTLITMSALLLIGLIGLTQNATALDYTGRNVGIGGSFGLGIKSQGIGAGFQFGIASKIKLVAGLNLDLNANLYVRSGALDFQVAPSLQYIFRFAKAPIHPYVGFGPALHVVNQKKTDNYNDPYYNPYDEPYGDGWKMSKLSFNGESSEFEPGSDKGTKAKIGLQFITGAEFPVSSVISIYNDYRYHLIFGSADNFTIGGGILFYVD